MRPYVSRSSVMKYSATALAIVKLMNPEREIEMNVELIQGMSVEPTELTPIHKLKPKLRTLAG